MKSWLYEYKPETKTPRSGSSAHRTRVTSPPVRAYTPRCEMEDLKQEAALALLDAARRFDPAHGTKLLTYATPVMEAALSDYAARHAFPLSIPASRAANSAPWRALRAEAQDASETELTKAVCEKLRVSSKAAEALLKEYTLCRARQLGDDVFSISCGGDPCRDLATA